MAFPTPLDANSLSRRAFMLAGTGLTTAHIASPLVAAGAITAQQVIERIKRNVGIPWRAETVDNVVAGNPETPIRGIATTMMATLDVIQRAVKAGKNLVITHEPTFYLHQDKPDAVAQDAIYQFKTDFIHKHDVVVFHFHDHWHGRQPDGIATGMVRELGWEENRDPRDSRLFVFPGTPLLRFAKEIQSRLKARTMRILGDPKLVVNRVTASWGYVSQVPGIPLLARPDVDVLVVGETREWELVEYAQDAVAAGKKKALILLGHVLSEQAGMKYCAEWLRSFGTEVPIEFVPATDPFWNLANPAT